jgi:predicted dehydrogenase
MSKKIRWGILGAGRIANKFAADLALVNGAELTTIASQDQSRGKEFAKKFNIPIYLDSYEKLVRSPDVDVIYIATPHGFHYQHAMLCLNHGKAVLCEKAFALNSHQLKEIVTFAKSKKVFLMEAFWTKFIPQFIKIKEMIGRGDIGEIKLIQADFGFKASSPPAQRLTDLELGGGSLLDIGIYPVFLATTLLGRPVEIKALMTPYTTGADEQCVVVMKFESGALTLLSSTLASDTPTEALIAGTEGRIQMRNRFHNPVGRMEIVRTVDKIEKVEEVDVERENGFGYQFEARHVGDCLRKGLSESPVMSLSDSLLLMETLDRIRKECGIRYTVDRD